MGQLIVVTTPDLAPGYQLAGVDTFAVKNVDEAEETLQKLLHDPEASLIIVRRALLQALPDRLQRQLEASVQPVVMPIAGRPTHIPGKEYRSHLLELIRHTIGFHINFGTGAEESEKSSS
jgi:vacuolar-type H+-ATPase subunit F/Vma7